MVCKIIIDIHCHGYIQSTIRTEIANDISLVASSVVVEVVPVGTSSSRSSSIIKTKIKIVYLYSAILYISIFYSASHATKYHIKINHTFTNELFV